MKRKSMHRREPNGKPQREAKQQTRQHEMPSPAEVKRLRDAAMIGMRDAIWGTVLGYLHLSGKLSIDQFTAGVHWARLSRFYHRAMEGPRDPRSNLLTRVSTSNAPKPEQHDAHAMVQAYEAVMREISVTTHGAQRLAAMVRVCELNLLPTSPQQVQELVDGLEIARNFWLRR